jgi:transposase
LEKILHRERKTIAQVSQDVRLNANRISQENQSLIENKRFKQPKKIKGATEIAAEEIKQSAARTRRIERYETVKRLRIEGISISKISRRLRMDRHLVRHFSRCDEYPEVKPAFRKTSPLINYQDYIRRRWNEGCGNAKQIYQELLKLGYVGSYDTLMRFLKVWRSDLPKEDRLRIRLKTFRTPTTREIKWWLLGAKPKLNEEKSRFLELLQARQPEISEAVKLITEFRRILKKGDENDYENWQEKVRRTAGNQELKNFAFRLGKDARAIRGAITTDWSNGQTEGQVNRLKLIKRQMYGRASFEVLKAKVLFAEVA